MQFLAYTLREASNYDPSQPDHGRASAIAALVGVNQLIAVLFPNRPTLPVPLVDLACALKDLDRGTVAPLLQPRKLAHRAPNPLNDDLFRAIPAAAMTVLMNGGRKLGEAAGEVARGLGGMGYRDSSGNRISGSHIAKWRERMRTELASENLAVARYQLALERVKGAPAAEAAKFLLSNMQALYPAKIPKKPTS
jgi:hypothetical protein